MNDLTLEYNKAVLTIDESEGGIVIRIKELKGLGETIGKISPAKPLEVSTQAQIWLDQRAISRLYAFLRDVMPDTEGLNGCDY